MPATLKNIAKFLLFLAALLLALAFLSGATISWYESIRFGPDRAIARIGGYSLLGKTPTPTGSDKVFYDSLKITSEDKHPPSNSLTTCNQSLEACSSLKLASLNLRIQRGESTLSILNELEEYRTHMPVDENICPVKYEITKLALAAYVSNRTPPFQQTPLEQSLIQSVISQIFSETNKYKLYNTACRMMLEESPYLAHAYIYTLSTLSTSRAPPSKQAWQEVLNLPNIRLFSAHPPIRTKEKQP